MRYGRWVVTDDPPLKQFHLRCRCDCGVVRDVRPSSLKLGQSVSCGCYQREVSARLGKKTKTHGDASPRTRLYGIWVGMNQRCSDVNCNTYPRYGGKGITVTGEWRDYVTFKAWSLANGYTELLTLDRIDSTRGYSPENCRWATYTKQAENSPRTKWVEYKGERISLRQLSDKVGIERRVLYERIFISKWSLDRAVDAGATTGRKSTYKRM